jgi:hypothetical protein
LRNKRLQELSVIDVVVIVEGVGFSESLLEAGLLQLRPFDDKVRCVRGENAAFWYSLVLAGDTMESGFDFYAPVSASMCSLFYTQKWRVHIREKLTAALKPKRPWPIRLCLVGPLQNALELLEWAEFALFSACLGALYVVSLRVLQVG